MEPQGQPSTGVNPRDILAKLLSGIGQGLGQSQPDPAQQQQQPYLPPEELLRLQMGGQGPQPYLTPEQLLAQQMQGVPMPPR